MKNKSVNTEWQGPLSRLGRMASISVTSGRSSKESISMHLSDASVSVVVFAPLYLEA